VRCKAPFRVDFEWGVLELSEPTRRLKRRKAAIACSRHRLHDRRRHPSSRRCHDPILPKTVKQRLTMDFGHRRALTAPYGFDPAVLIRFIFLRTERGGIERTSNHNVLRVAGSPPPHLYGS